MQFWKTIDWVKVNLCLLILILALMTRFVAPIETHNIAFDEAYFIPQSENYAVGTYYFDIHPPLGKIILYLASLAVDPTVPSRITPDKPSSGPVEFDKYIPASLEASRFAPHIAGSIVPVLIFLIAWEVINMHKKQHQDMVDRLTSSGYMIPLMIGLLGVFDNMLIVDSRYALLTQILLCFILAAIYFAMKYFNAPMTRVRFVYLACAAIALGLAISTKWLGLSCAPVILGLLAIKEAKGLTKKNFIQVLAKVYVGVAILAVIPILVYLSVFAWHFGQINQYRGNHLISEDFKNELVSGERKLTLWDKIVDWHHLSLETDKAIPQIDYSNPGEIGSTWLEWPVLTRPILYAIQPGQNDTYGYVFLLGNPFIWFSGLVSIIFVAFICVAQLLETLWNLFDAGKFQYAFKFRYWLVLGLYLVNWLPFGLIHRVMYLYHYVPAMIISMVAFGLIIHDIVLPILEKIITRFLPTKYRVEVRSYLMLVVFAGILICGLVVFYIYAPLTYQWAVNHDYLEKVELIDNWEVVW